MTRCARLASLTLVVAVLTTTACSLLPDRSGSSTGPSPTGVDQLAGSWSSVASATTLANVCTTFTWQVTQISGDTGSGSFTATCLGELSITGTASGTLSGSTVTWSATATATTPGGASCPITLSGTATIDGAQIRIPYTGQTCLGPVSGTEILRRS